MPPVYTYLEQAADNSPASASFTARQQSASAPYITQPANFVDMPNRLIDVLGYTGTKVLTGVAAGKLNRVLPLRHPQYQWLFADSFRPRGVGANNTVMTPGAGPTGTGIIPQFPLYGTYSCDISFSPRDYNSWVDNDIGVYGTQGYDRQGNVYTYSYAAEWMRFCKFELRPLNNFIDAKQGQMRFRTRGLDAPANPDPNGVQYQDAPRLYLPDSALKVKWYQVPYRYITSPNSYLRNFIGHINQVAWGDQILNQSPTFGPFPPGSLLYHGATPVAIYQNTVPDEGLLAFNYAAGTASGFGKAMLCDLELDFTYTARQPSSALNTPSPPNGNWIAAGHNLLPWQTTRSFYYVTTFDPKNPDTQAKWRPTFNSFPFSLLFTDPDVPYTPSAPIGGPYGSPVFSAGTAPIGP